VSKLFWKIFLWFWLAMTLIGAILVAVALTNNPRDDYVKRQTQRFTDYGHLLIKAYETAGPRGLNDLIRSIRDKEGVALVLVNVGTETPGLQAQQPQLPRFSRPVIPGRLRLPPPFREPQPRREREAKHFTIPLDGDYVLFAEVPPPSRMEILLNPEILTIRLLVTFLVAGVVCYILARSLTSPILKLRQAAQEFAGGNLATRVAPRLGQNSGELFDLAHDFDRMAEQIETLLNSQQRLLRDISHELRSPLARLNIALELVRRQGAANSPRHLDRIAKESEKLNAMIGQLLAITRLEGGADHGRETGPVALDELLRRVVADANYEGKANGRSAELTIQRPVTIVGVEELLHSALENVVRNSLRYTIPDGPVAVVLDLSADGRGAVITVSDHGPGVPDSDLSRLFQPFYRVSEARDRQSGGAGVGLAIAERAIRLHGGTITAANLPSGGLLVSITLPLPWSVNQGKNLFVGPGKNQIAK
jgi:two-component system sensor histidine kinase CpxA